MLTKKKTTNKPDGIEVKEKKKKKAGNDEKPSEYNFWTPFPKLVISDEIAVL